jgi:hypothetical protein
MGLLVIAGARVVPQSALVVVVALGALVVAKVAGSAMSTALLRAAFRSRVGDSQRFLWVLVPQGAVGLAVVLEARLLYPSWVPDPVLTVAVLGFLALELFVPLALRAGRHHPALEGAA